VLKAQDQGLLPFKKPLNSVFINFFGDASLLSLNAEHLFKTGRFSYVSGKVGLGYNREFVLNNAPSDVYTTIPFHLTYNIGKTNHFLEVGFGATQFFGNTSLNLIPYPILGYRILPSRQKKLNLRVYVQVPFDGLEQEGILFIPVGASIGYCF